MSRPRGADAGAVLHVGCRGVNRMTTFGNDREYQMFMALLRRVVKTYRWSALAYCLMGNHHHLLVRLTQSNLPEGMRELHRGYATWVNQTRGREGRVWDGPYWSRVVVTERHLFACLRYIARNPIEARQCKTPEAWPWSSHRALAEGWDDGITDIDSVVPCLAEDEETARRVYLDLVTTDPRSTDSIELATAHVVPDRTEGILRAHRLGFSVEDIARELGCHPRTVRRHLKTK